MKTINHSTRLPILAFIAISTFCLAPFRSSATIHHRTINKTITLKMTYNLDIDGDSINDFTMYIDTLPIPVEYYCIMDALAGDEMLDSSEHGYLTALDKDATMGGPWSGGHAVLGTYPATQFAGLGNKYVGLRHFVGGDFYYAWLLVNLSANRDTLTILESGYNDIPNSSLKTGQIISSGLADLSPPEFNIFTDRRTLFISSSSSTPADLNIYASSGQLVYHSLMDNNLNVTLPLAGFYVVSLQSEKGLMRKKVVVGE